MAQGTERLVDLLYPHELTENVSLNKVMDGYGDHVAQILGANL
jgi:hypothetical protein